MSFETKINEEKLIEASKMKNEIKRDRRLAAHIINRIRVIRGFGQKIVVKYGFGLDFYLQVQIKLQAKRTNIKTKSTSLIKIIFILHEIIILHQANN
jgi:hypothetical protein